MCDKFRQRALFCTISKIGQPLLMAETELEIMKIVFRIHDIKSHLGLQASEWHPGIKMDACKMLHKLFHNRHAWREYHRRMRSVIYNVKNSPDLALRLERGDLTAAWLVRATPRELWPQRWDNIVKQLPIVMPEEATTTQFLCGRCKQRKTTYTQMQTRSADEPMTTFVRCTNCGNRWKC